MTTLGSCVLVVIITQADCSQQPLTKRIELLFRSILLERKPGLCITARASTSRERQSFISMKEKTTSTTAASVTTCPYAVALHHEEKKEGDTDSSTSAHDNNNNNALLHSCPAFEQGSCPFKDAKSADEVRQKLLTLPPSHLEESGRFHHVIQELHQLKPATLLAENDNDTAAFHLPGGCPVQSVLAKKKQTAAEEIRQLSFTEAVEGMSLSAIMARMASEMMDHEDSSSSTANDNVKPLAAAAAAAAADIESSPAEESSTKSSSTDELKSRESRRVSLSESLKTGTAVSHQDAEDVHFVRNFIRGKIDRGLYADLVTALYHVYKVLEDALNRHAPHHFGSCHFPRELARTETLLEDMDFWHGRVVDTISPATQDYVDRLQFVARTDPLLLLAHAYTRYLGDLSGGKILARVARKAMMLGSDHEGLAFYQFAHVPSAKKFKDQYRQALDALPLTSVQIQKLVAEANVAFCLNMRLFEELDVKANVPGAAVRPLSHALAYASVPAVQDENNKGSSSAEQQQCPFILQQQQQQQQESGKNTVATTTVQQKRCPWPFVVAHDPAQFLRDWQTWLVVGLLLCWGWSLFC